VARGDELATAISDANDSARFQQLPKRAQCCGGVSQMGQNSIGIRDIVGFRRQGRFVDVPGTKRDVGETSIVCQLAPELQMRLLNVEAIN